MVYSRSVVEVVFPLMRPGPLLFLIHLAGKSWIGGLGWLVLGVFVVEPGLANGFLTL